MTEPKFQVGDKILDLRYGWGVVSLPQSDSKVVPFYIQNSDGTRFPFYEDGRIAAYKFPIILTVEEAAKLGYFPPKKKVKKKLYAWLIKNIMIDTGGRMYPAYTFNEHNASDQHSIYLRFPALDTEIEVESEE